MKSFLCERCKIVLCDLWNGDLDEREGCSGRGQPTFAAGSAIMSILTIPHMEIWTKKINHRCYLVFTLEIQPPAPKEAPPGG